MVHLRVLLVVDGYFSLGPQDRNDRSFSISHLLHTFKASKEPRIFLDTAHRDGDLDATIYGKFKFDDSEMLKSYDQIWLLGYNGPNRRDPTNVNFRGFLSDSELRNIAEYMEQGGGIFADGDHESLGSFMCGRIPRVRTMRKWFKENDSNRPTYPNDKKLDEAVAALYNWPAAGKDRADTLQADESGDFDFTNQSDDVPQPLSLVNPFHEVFQMGNNRFLTHYPDHFHEGETLGFGGVPASQPWTINDKLSLDGKEFVEYPESADHREVPRVIAMGHCIGGHQTTVEADKLCDSGFDKDDTYTKEKTINTLSAYDGHTVGVGRIITDSSFHHFCDLNIVGDPCAAAVKTTGLSATFRDDMDKFYINLVKWLARKQVHTT